MALISPTAGLFGHLNVHIIYSVFQQKKSRRVFIWIVHAFMAVSFSTWYFHLLSLDGVKVKSCKKKGGQVDDTSVSAMLMKVDGKSISESESDKKEIRCHFPH